MVNILWLKVYISVVITSVILDTVNLLTCTESNNLSAVFIKLEFSVLVSRLFIVINSQVLYAPNGALSPTRL